jgi:hypothetical protein
MRSIARKEINRMTSNNIVITISILAAAFLFGCSESKPLDIEHEHDHEKVGGLVLLVDEEEVHHQLQTEQDGVVHLREGDTLDVEVILLNEDGEPLEEGHDHHEGEDDHGHEHGRMESQQEEEEELGHALVFTGYDDRIILIHAHDHENGHDEGTHEGEEDEEHEGLGFELTGVAHGETAFTLWLLEEERTVYTSLPILTHVEHVEE